MRQHGSETAAHTDNSRPISRRGILLGLAAGLTALSTLSASPALAAPSRLARRLARVLSNAARGTGSHANGNPRGIDIAVVLGRLFQGRFGVMFPTLKAFAPADELLDQLAQQMIDRSPPLSDVKDSNDGFDNPNIPAGYAYMGQFIDHDMTLDKTPLGEQRKDPRATLNYDTPFFDLGSVYGRGPALDPQLYDPADKRLMRLGVGADGLPDLPRNANGVAVIGDPRNDENLIVAQLHLAFLQFHNGHVRAGKTFEEAQKLTRWHFQWLIVNDFLAHIVGHDVVNSILKVSAGRPATVALKFYKPKNKLRPMMPIEYSGAAYRFGHSMIRAEYEMFDGNTIPFFGGSRDLRGGRPIPDFARIDWNYFFQIPGLGLPDDRNMTRHIDTQLALPLAELPPTVVQHIDGAILNLAHRNLVRGRQLGLPCGQDVARAMGIAPLSNAQLGLTNPAWGGKAPLWFYILKESELATGGLRLGPVGGRIIAEVILGILALDRTSYLNAPQGWNPEGPYSCGHLLVEAGVITIEGHPEQEGVDRPEEPEAVEEVEEAEVEVEAQASPTEAPASSQSPAPTEAPASSQSPAPTEAPATPQSAAPTEAPVASEPATAGPTSTTTEAPAAEVPPASTAPATSAPTGSGAPASPELVGAPA